MASQRVGLRNIHQGRAPSRLRLLAPLRYLWIYHPEKSFYDVRMPVLVGTIAWAAYWLITPQIPLFGDDGLLHFTRDLLVMAVPFLIGALATVAMSGPSHLDKRTKGEPLTLNGNELTLRQFVCYLLGYISFVGLITLGAAVTASLLHDPVVHWIKGLPNSQTVSVSVHLVGSLCLAWLLSVLSVTTLWSLYFLTDIVNQTD